MEYPKFDDINRERLPIEKEFIAYVLEHYLIYGKTAVDIENEYYAKEISTGALVAKVLNSFGLISATKDFDNRGIYTGMSKDYIINFLLKGNEQCQNIAYALCEKEMRLEDEESSIPYSEEDFKREVFIPDEKYLDIVSLLKRKQNIIITGAPGVGKTFMAKRLVYSILGKKITLKYQ